MICHIKLFSDLVHQTFFCHDIFWYSTLLHRPLSCPSLLLSFFFLISVSQLLILFTHFWLMSINDVIDSFFFANDEWKRLMMNWSSTRGLLYKDSDCRDEWLRCLTWYDSWSHTRNCSPNVFVWSWIERSYVFSYDYLTDEYDKDRDLEFPEKRYSWERWRLKIYEIIVEYFAVDIILT